MEKKLLMFLASLLLLACSSCSTSKILVKNCTKIGEIVYECEEIK